MGLFSEGSDMLSDVFRDTEDVQVVYALGSPGEGAYQITVYATKGATSLEQEPGVFTTSRTSNRDFLIDKADILFFDEEHTPVPGDKIIHTSNAGDVYQYEVMDVPGEGAWRWHDDDYVTYRIHTTLVKVGAY